jgi:hypothetical protein
MRSAALRDSNSLRMGFQLRTGFEHALITSSLLLYMLLTTKPFRHGLVANSMYNTLSRGSFNQTTSQLEPQERALSIQTKSDNISQTKSGNISYLKLIYPFKGL